MASFLEPMAGAIYAGFKGKLLTGIIRRIAAAPSDPPGDSLLDGYGDPISPSPSDLPIEGFEDAYSDFIKGSAGIPDTDVKVNIFGASIPGYQPAKDDIVRLDRKTKTGIVSTWYQLRGSRTDPAQALWVCQAFVIPAPA